MMNLAALVLMLAVTGQTPSSSCANECSGKVCRCDVGQPCFVTKDTGSCVMATLNPPGWTDPHKVKPKVAAPVLHYQTDLFGQRWHDTDAANLRRWVDYRNAQFRNSPPRATVPACTNGRCGR